VQTFLIILFLLLPTAALADVYNCNGNWTNKPCDGGKKAFKEKEHVPLSPEQIKEQDAEKQQREKSFLVADFRRQAEETKKRGISSFKSKAAIKFCERSTTSLDDCAAKLSAADDELASFVDEEDKKLIELEKIRIDKQRNRQLQRY